MSGAIQKWAQLQQYSQRGSVGSAPRPSKSIVPMTWCLFSHLMGLTLGAAKLFWWMWQNTLIKITSSESPEFIPTISFTNDKGVRVNSIKATHISNP